MKDLKSRLFPAHAAAGEKEPFGRESGRLFPARAAAGQATVEYLLLLIVIVALAMYIALPMGRGLKRFFGAMFDVPTGYYYCLTHTGLLPGLGSIQTSSTRAVCPFNYDWSLLDINAPGFNQPGDGGQGGAGGAGGRRGGSGSGSRGSRAGGSNNSGENAAAGEDGKTAAPRGKTSKSSRKRASKRSRARKGKGAKNKLTENSGAADAEEGAGGPEGGSGSSTSAEAAGAQSRAKLIAAKSSIRKKRKKRRKRTKLALADSEGEETFQSTTGGRPGSPGQFRYNRTTGYLGALYIEDESEEEERPPAFQATAASRSAEEKAREIKKNAQLSKAPLQKKQRELKDPEPLSFGNMIKYFVIAAIIIGILAAVFSQVMEMQSRE